MSVRRTRLPLAHTPGRAHFMELADNAGHELDSSAGALAPSETVGGETNRRCA